MTNYYITTFYFLTCTLRVVKVLPSLEFYFNPNSRSNQLEQIRETISLVQAISSY